MQKGTATVNEQATIPPLADLLRTVGACDEARYWARPYESPAAAWEACEQPEWMLWALDRCGLWDDRLARRFMAWCARSTPLLDGRTTWDLLTDGRSRAAVEIAERMAAGEEIESAARSMAESAAWSAAESMAASAARSATESAAASAARSPTESAAESTAWSAAWSAARSPTGPAAWPPTGPSAWSAARSAQAKILRQFFGNPFRDAKVLSRIAGL
jgi:hypothetical protein